MKNIFYYQTNIGRIGISEENTRITNLFFETDVHQNQNTGFYLKETDLLSEAISQLYEYLRGNRQVFTLPLAPAGTMFMKKVWECLCNIPYGTTKSYKDIALLAGNEKACRAVGLANNKNPIPIFIPCHRVIGSNGKLTGYRGGVQTKHQLLELEKNLFALSKE